MSKDKKKRYQVCDQTRKAIILSAYYHACKNSEKRDLDKDINTEVNHKGSLVDASMMKTQNVDENLECQWLPSFPKEKYKNQEINPPLEKYDEIFS
jgi:hypothetical protein